jgi:hypothetical protein
VFDLVEFKPDNCIGLPLFNHISQLRLLDIKFIKTREYCSIFW